jgi:hypothetical protein
MLFILSFCFHFFILIGAMNESTLERLRWKTKEKEVDEKVEAFRKEQIEKKSVEHVWLTKAIYVEPLASRAPIAKETKVFEQE